MPDLFDAHGHLQDLPPEEVGAALARARAAGVTRVACCATGENDWARVLALAASHPEVVPHLGLHPWKVAAARPGWEARLEALLAASRAGVGECGLDFARQPVNREAQVSALRVQLRLASHLGRPVALHCVRAWGALMDLLREEGLPPGGALVHAFAGSPETARELQAMGLYLSFRAAGPELGAARADRVLLESDSAEPADVAALAARAAGDLAGRAHGNAIRFFGGILA